MNMKTGRKHIGKIIILLTVLLALAALVVFVFVPIYSEQEDKSENKVLVLSYDGDKEPIEMENDFLHFTLDPETTQFNVTDKKSGNIWYSNPQDSANDKLAKSGSINGDFLLSTLSIRYFQKLNETEYNNYTYSVKNKNYNVSLQEDGSVRVDYTIGKIERVFMIPTAITKDRYDAFRSNMSSKDKGKLGNFYTAYDPAKKDKFSDWDEMVTMYPSLSEQVLYILKSDTTTENKEKVEGFFEKAGYTQEDFDEDAKLVAGTKELDIPVFNVSIIYRLDGEDFVVEVPYSEIAYKSEYPISYVSVLPMFGAAGVSDNGFIIVPEGSGALINYNNGKVTQNQYYADFYGWDYGKKRSTVVNETDNAIAVYGMSRKDQGAFICMLEGASSFGGIVADISGKTNSYNYAYAKYSVLHFDDYDITGRTAERQIMFEENIPDVTVCQRYRFLKEDSYIAMASAYGEYLKGNENWYEAELMDNLPVNVELVGAINKTIVRFGVPVDSVVTTTSYRDAIDIINELKTNGVDNLNIRMTGWCNGGVWQKVLTDIDPVSGMGGDNGISELINVAKESDVDLYFDGITCFAYDSDVFDGFVPFIHAARNTTRDIVELYPYDIVTYQQADWMDPYYLVHPEYSSELAANLIQDLADRGATGIAFRDRGNLLSSDFYRKNPYSREESKEEDIQVLLNARAAGLKVVIKNGNDYAVPYADMITDVRLVGKDYSVLDESIPFYEVALHGSREYLGEPINLAGDYVTELLNCAEYGAGLNFTFMEEDTDVLLDSMHSCYSSANYDSWKSVILPMINRYQRETAGLNRESIVGHSYLSENVTETVYSDGTKVVVNYSDYDFVYQDKVVQARDYLVERRK